MLFGSTLPFVWEGVPDLSYISHRDHTTHGLWSGALARTCTFRIEINLDRLRKCKPCQPRKLVENIVTWNMRKLYSWHLIHVCNWCSNKLLSTKLLYIWHKIIWNNEEFYRWYMIAILICKHGTIYKMSGHNPTMFNCYYLHFNSIVSTTMRQCCPQLLRSFNHPYYKNYFVSK